VHTTKLQQPNDSSILPDRSPFIHKKATITPQLAELFFNSLSDQTRA